MKRAKDAATELFKAQDYQGAFEGYGTALAIDPLNADVSGTTELALTCFLPTEKFCA